MKLFNRFKKEKNVTENIPEYKEWTLEDAKIDYDKKFILPELKSKNCRNCKFCNEIIGESDFFCFGKCDCQIKDRVFVCYDSCEYFNYSDEVKKEIKRIEGQ